MDERTFAFDIDVLRAFLRTTLRGNEDGWVPDMDALAHLDSELVTGLSGRLESIAVITPSEYLGHHRSTS